MKFEELRKLYQGTHMDDRRHERRYDVQKGVLLQGEVLVGLYKYHGRPENMWGIGQTEEEACDKLLAALEYRGYEPESVKKVEV
jgi:hypothetical protein